MDLLEVFNYLLISVLLLITFTLYVYHVSRDSASEIKNTVVGKVYISICGVLISMVVQHYAIRIPNAQTVIDLNALLLLTIFYLGGMIPTVIIAVFQCIIWGFNYGFSIGMEHVIVRAVLYLGAFYLIDRINEEKRVQRWYLSLASVVLITVPSLYILLKEVDFTVFLRDYTGTMIITAAIQFWILEKENKAKQMYLNYKKESDIDYLTELKNTRAFDTALNNEIIHAQETGEQLSFLIFDIDFFKRVNDTYGHSKGDIILKETAKILNKSLPKTAIIARIGGEEFCALLRNTTQEEAKTAANQVRQTVEKNAFRISRTKAIKITISAGVSNYPKTTENLNKLKELADEALYDAKRSGRNRVHVR